MDYQAIFKYSCQEAARLARLMYPVSQMNSRRYFYNKRKWREYFSRVRKANGTF
jgi:hypothetical protein